MRVFMTLFLAFLALVGLSPQAATPVVAAAAIPAVAIMAVAAIMVVAATMAVAATMVELACTAAATDMGMATITVTTSPGRPTLCSGLFSRIRDFPACRSKSPILLPVA